jgi:hypothetical protein
MRTESPRRHECAPAGGELGQGGRCRAGNVFPGPGLPITPGSLLEPQADQLGFVLNWVKLETCIGVSGRSAVRISPWPLRSLSPTRARPFFLLASRASLVQQLAALIMGNT